MIDEKSANRIEKTISNAETYFNVRNFIMAPINDLVSINYYNSLQIYYKIFLQQKTHMTVVPYVFLSLLVVLY